MVKVPVLVWFLPLIASLLPSSSLPAPLFPCFFIFGDSFVDNGNNNNLNTSAKANYLPYGVDFPLGPTGRFANGRTPADFLAQMFGFDNFIPPFATAKGLDTINGVNYASGSAGIRNETGRQLGNPISLDNQLKNHNITVSLFGRLYGSIGAAKHCLNQCLYYFVIGSNDYINNYYQSEYYSTSKSYTIKKYAVALIQMYSQQLKGLYNVGARKVAVSALAPLGCLPAMVARSTNGSSCVEPINDAVRLFNDRLKGLVNVLNNELTDAKFVYLKAMDLRPTQLLVPGIGILNGSPCCKVSSTSGLCVAAETPCPRRDQHFFYDNYHPTEIVNKAFADASYNDILKLIS